MVTEAAHRDALCHGVPPGFTGQQADRQAGVRQGLKLNTRRLVDLPGALRALKGDERPFQLLGFLEFHHRPSTVSHYPSASAASANSLYRTGASSTSASSTVVPDGRGARA